MNVVTQTIVVTIDGHDWITEKVTLKQGEEVRMENLIFPQPSGLRENDSVEDAPMNEHTAVANRGEAFTEISPHVFSSVRGQTLDVAPSYFSLRLYYDAVTEKIIK